MSFELVVSRYSVKVDGHVCGVIVPADDAWVFVGRELPYPFIKAASPDECVSIYLDAIK